MHFALGLILCFSSLVSSSAELIIVSIMGKGMKFNPLDAILYMSLPVAAILVLPILLLQHPVIYPGHLPSTDWGILKEVWELNRYVLLLVLLSGVFAFIYNLLLYNMV